jgi:hypothetical protein
MYANKRSKKYKDAIKEELRNTDENVIITGVNYT